jgi:hypothetical protein
MVLTKQDLQDWNSNAVTQQILKEIEAAAIALKGESSLRDTVDQTAMQTAYNEGMLEGVRILSETYEDALEGSE